MVTDNLRIGSAESDHFCKIVRRASDSAIEPSWTSPRAAENLPLLQRLNESELSGSADSLPDVRAGRSWPEPTVSPVDFPRLGNI
jgi:hypothetical protein